MSKDRKQMLTATWTDHQDPTVEDPTELYWSDGRSATLEEYRYHQVDTHVIVDDRPGRYVVHMFPDFVGEVVFKRDLGTWALCHDGKVIPLDVSDPEAPYDILISEVYTHPIAFKVRIVRD